MRLNVFDSGEQLEDVDCFKYLESEVEADGGCERNVIHMQNE